MTGNSSKKKEQSECNNRKNSSHNSIFCDDLTATRTFSSQNPHDPYLIHLGNNSTQNKGCQAVFSKNFTFLKEDLVCRGVSPQLRWFHPIQLHGEDEFCFPLP